MKKLLIGILFLCSFILCSQRLYSWFGSHAYHSIKHTATHVTHYVKHGLTEVEKKAKERVEEAKKKLAAAKKKSAELARKAKKKLEEAKRRSEETAKKAKEAALKEEKTLSHEVKGLKTLPKKTLNVVHSVYHSLDDFGKKTMKNTLNKYWHELKGFINDAAGFGEKMLICIMAEFEYPLWSKMMEKASKYNPNVKVKLNRSLKYSETCFLCSHNSYSNYVDYYIPYGQQVFSYKKQLDSGVRAFMLDTWRQDGKIVLSHNKVFIQKFMRPIAYASNNKKTLYYADALKEIKSFLIRNPHQIITIILEDYVKSGAMFTKVYQSTGLKKYIYTDRHYYYELDKKGKKLKRDDKGKLVRKKEPGWNTIGEMIKLNKRLVIFVDSISESEYQFKQWRFMVENQYGTLSRQKASEERSSSVTAGKSYKKRGLLLLNYFNDDPRSDVKQAFTELVKVDFKDLSSYPKHLNKALDYLVKSFDDINARSHRKINSSKLRLFLRYERMNGLIHGHTRRYKNRYPNFIAPDFISEGNPMGIVEDINRKALRDSKKMFFPLQYKKAKKIKRPDISFPHIGF
ncbi:hypothetical protein KAJ27_19945 [bacterium]|nr:hypothetical protein [bacterium]